MKPAPIARILFFTLIMILLGGCEGRNLALVFVPSGSGIVETTVMGEDTGGWFGESSKVAMIDVTGIISDGGAGLIPFTSKEGSVSRLAESLNKAAEDSNVKAVILAINSPGGTVTASDLMYRELKHFKETTRKPVIVLMGAVTASGGYYLAVGGDVLIANPTTVTGSIGVIMQTVNLSQGMQRIGIEADAITSGPNKSLGNAYEPMPAEHRELLQSIVNDMYTTFKGIVIANRPQLDQAKLDMITDGRVVTGGTAVELGVVDRLGDVRDAFEEAKVRAGLKRAKLVKYHRATEYVGSAYAIGPASPLAGSSQPAHSGGADGSTQINLMQLNLGSAGVLGRTPFLYIWDPAAW